MSSMANFDQFNKEIQEIRMPRKGSEFSLFIDPYDNQGNKKSFKVGSKKYRGSVNDEKK